MSLLQELFELSEAKKKKPKCTCDGTEDGDASCKLHGKIEEGAALKRDASQEGKRQARIKEILRKLNNKVITKQSADKQLRDVGHPGVDLTEAKKSVKGPATGTTATWSNDEDIRDHGFGDKKCRQFCKDNGITVSYNKETKMYDYKGPRKSLDKLRDSYMYGDPDVDGHLYDDNGRSFDSEDGEPQE